MKKLIETLNKNEFVIRVFEVTGKNYVEVQFEVPGKFYRVKYMVNNHKFTEKIDYFVDHFELDLARKSKKSS